MIGLSREEIMLQLLFSREASFLRQEDLALHISASLFAIDNEHVKFFGAIALPYAAYCNRAYFSTLVRATTKDGAEKLKQASGELDVAMDYLLQALDPKNFMDPTFRENPVAREAAMKMLDILKSESDEDP